MALLGRHAAITRFGTDEFTGNFLFAVCGALTIGRYCGSQSVIGAVFNRLSTLFRRREIMAIAKMISAYFIAMSEFIAIFVNH